MSLNHTNISPLIETQFPSFLRDEGRMFVTFVKEYYKWLESTGNVLYHSRRVLDYGDIDNTLDEFLPHFQEKYLVNTPINSISNQRALVKHSRELYQSKGTIDSLRLIFNMLFGEEIDVYYPSDNILRASDGVWQVPQYLEISISDRTTSFVGRDIVGSISGTRAFVERVDRRTNDGSIVDVMFITNVRPGSNSGFIFGELISDNGIVANAPTITGSMSSIAIIQAGAGFTTGQDVEVVSTRTGIEGRARVTAIGNRTGEVNYKLLDGGYGYVSNTSNSSTFGTFGFTDVIVSSNVLIVEHTNTTNTYSTGFVRFNTVTQPLVNVAFSAANTSLAVGSLVYGINSTANVVTAGYVISANQVGANGTLLISPQSISSITIDTVTYANTITGSFNVGEVVYQSNGVANLAIGIVSTANSTAVVIDQHVGPFIANTTLRGFNSAASANVATVKTYAYESENFANADVTSIVLASTLNGATKGTATSKTATANIMGSNATAVGIYQVGANPFVPNAKSWIYSSSNTATITAIVNAVSTGSPGGFKVGAIGSSEIIYVDTDFISPYMGLTINAASYGLPANTSAGYTSVIATTLSKTALSIGTITSLTERNPGLNNTTKPFAVEYQRTVVGFAKPSRVVCHLSNTSGNYNIGEPVTQAVPLNRTTLTVADVSGVFSYATHEIIKQVRGDGHTVYGELYAASPSSVSCYIANTANTFDSVSPITGITSGATANVTNAVTGTINSFARGTVEGIYNNGADILLHRTSFQDFKVGNQLYGSETGSTATVTDVSGVATSELMGLDAVVDPLAGVFDGTISTVEIVDSGILYQDGETVELTFSGHQTPAYGVARVETNGRSQGRYVGTRGTLDSTVKIQDNEYYQEYSYEIRSGIDRARYENAVKSVTHVAGTKMFNKYVSSAITLEPIAIASAAYDRITTLSFSNVVGTFSVGQIVQQGNTASGTVLSFNSTLNTMDVVDVTGNFTANSTHVIPDPTHAVVPDTIPGAYVVWSDNFISVACQPGDAVVPARLASIVTGSLISIDNNLLTTTTAFAYVFDDSGYPVYRASVDATAPEGLVMAGWLLAPPVGQTTFTAEISGTIDAINITLQ